MTTPRKRLEELTKGKERLREIVEGRPYAQQVIQTEILYDLAGMTKKILDEQVEATERLVRIQNAIEAEHPKGLLEWPGKLLDVTDEILEYKPTHIWLSLYGYNYGPDTAYIQTNDRSLNFYPLRINEDVSADFKTPTITNVFLKCDSGGTAQVKLLGKW